MQGPFNALIPPVRRIPSARQLIRAENERVGIRLVVLDDDPTGCQTVHDVPVLLNWDGPTFANALREHLCVYILHNSRSVSGEEAAERNTDILRQLTPLLPANQLRLVSRSDSTLRGHFRVEVETLEREATLGPAKRGPAGPFDGLLVVPYFGEGGRLTMNDTHFVVESDQLIPAHETEFARDPVFGFSTAYLPDWIAQQSAGRWTPGAVHSISLDAIRTGGVATVTEILMGVREFSPVVVNATCDEDLEIVVLGIQEAERQGKRFLYRTAASFVKIRAGMDDRPLYQPTPDERGPGLIVVGSHVPKTTRQVETLGQQLGLPELELRIDRILGDDSERYRQAVSHQLDTWLSGGQTPVVFTERAYKLTGTAGDRLRAGQRISAFLSDLVRNLTIRPRFIVAKGGITAHDIARQGLAIKTALVLGQLLPGIPVWRTGEESRFPGLLYVVFPGNVGDDNALGETVAQLTGN